MMTVQPRLNVSPSEPKATSNLSIMVVSKVTPCSGLKPSTDTEKDLSIKGSHPADIFIQ